MRKVQKASGLILGGSGIAGRAVRVNVANFPVADNSGVDDDKAVSK
jgi:hypothetical protein